MVCKSCVDLTYSAFPSGTSAFDPTQPQPPISNFVVLGQGRPEIWRVSLLQQADASQPALIRLVGENGRYLARSNTMMTLNGNITEIFLSVDALISTEASIWQVRVNGSDFDLVTPFDPTAVTSDFNPTFFSYCFGCLLYLDIMTASNATSDYLDGMIPMWTAKRVPESVLLVNNMLNGYDDIQLPFWQNDTVKMRFMVPGMGFLFPYAINLVETTTCTVDLDTKSTQIMPLKADLVRTSSVPNGTMWTVNYVGSPNDGLVQFFLPNNSNYTLAYVPTDQLPSNVDTGTVDFGVVCAMPASSNSTRSLWQLAPTSTADGQQLWYLQAYDVIQANGSNSGPIQPDLDFAGLSLCSMPTDYISSNTMSVAQNTIVGSGMQFIVV